MQIFNHDLERELVSCVLMLEESRAYAFANIAPEDFSDEMLAKLYKKIKYLYLHNKGFAIADLVDGEVPSYFISELMEYPRATVENICASMENIVRVRKLRMAAKEVEHIITNGIPLHLDKMIAEIENIFLTSIEGKRKESVVNYKSAIVTALSKMENAINGKTGLKTGFSSLDKILIGLQSDSLTIIAARPSMGKSMFVGSIVHYLAERKIPVFLVSLEMSAAQISLREMSAISGVAYSKIRSGNLTQSEVDTLVASGTYLEDLPVYIDEGSACSIEKLYPKCRMMKQQRNIGLIVIDHMGLMTSDSKKNGRYEEMNLISSGLKRLAKDLNTPVIALHQLSRKNEDRVDKIPKMSDLRDSGNIEQDADNVILLHRDEYYNEHSDRKGVMDVIVAKGRDCGVGKTQLLFRPDIMRYVEIPEHRQVYDYSNESEEE